mmetsp:Transcript_7293/g.15810  ORF Transcript_7293/g.15810 Transcript_7293/m.15810 type:complete len:135 (-) Transcript_7293:67-471(-)
MPGIASSGDAVASGLSSLMPDLHPPEERALVAAAHARMKARVDALDCQAQTMEAVRQALAAKASAGKAADAVVRAEAARAEALRVEEAARRGFLGLSGSAEDATKRGVEDLVRDQAPGPPLFLPPMVPVAPRLS